jgi:parallel beta-helix repeat protein/predicted outer membrane repeat protein
MFGGDAIIIDCIFESNGGGGWGGGIFIDEALPVISKCSFTNNYSSCEGGGIFICEASPLISNCNFVGNNSSAGGAIAYDIGGAIIENCLFDRNSALFPGYGWGGALYFKYGDATVTRCTFSGNFSDENGGAIAINMAEAEFRNCTISGNSALGNGGGLFVHWSAGIVVENCIVEGNFGNGGLYGDGEFSFSNISFGDFYNNEGGIFVGIGYPGEIGIIDTININGDSCDVYFNLFQNPLFADPAIGNFQLTWTNFPLPDSTQSPCINAGDPTSPLDPDGTISDIGAFYYHQAYPIIGLVISFSGSDAILQWEAVPNARLYHIYRSESPYFDITGMNPIASISENSYIDMNALAGGKYFYLVTYGY